MKISDLVFDQTRPKLKDKMDQEVWDMMLEDIKIENYRFVDPIYICSANHEGKHVVIDGRMRLLALLELGQTELKEGNWVVR